MDYSTSGFPVLHHLPSLLKLMSIELVMLSNNLILCYPLLLLPSIFPSISIFSDELALHIRWPKCWSFSVSITPSNEYSWSVSFRMDWIDLLAVQGIPKSLFQRHGSKTSNLDKPQFSSVQFSCSVMSNSLWPHRLKHPRLPCPSPVPRAFSNSCPLSQWNHPTISSSVVPFSSCLQS